MGTDVEVGERRGPGPASPPIAPERLTGQEGSLVRQVLASIEVGWQGILEGLDGIEAHGHLGVDEGVDDERRLVRDVLERAAGPRAPGGVGGHDVEQDVAVHHDGTHPSPRVRAMISSVVISTSPRPRRRSAS